HGGADDLPVRQRLRSGQRTTLGIGDKVFTNETADAFTARVDELLADSPKPSPAVRAAARTTTAYEIFADEHGREPTASELSAAVAGYSRPRLSRSRAHKLCASCCESGGHRALPP
ncbi:MAG TPA: hypothetical protein VGS60_16150, partial [Actinomycetes bacterium]|nr:hypothetical protein [Actinomycetes bacterium]